MTHYLNHLNLTKGKISKLYKKKKQTLKKKHGKRIKRGGRSYRKKKHLNLANKTVKKKNMQNGGGMFDWLTSPTNKQEEKQPLNTNNPSSSSQGLFSRLYGNKSPVMNEYQPPVINPILQPSDIQQSNEKQEKMNQVIQELRDKLKRENKLQDSQPEVMDDDVSNIPFDEEPTDQSLMNPIHLNAGPEKVVPVPSTEYGEEKVVPVPSTEYGEEKVVTVPSENQMIEYNQVTPEENAENETPQVNPEELKPSNNCDYLNEIEIPECMDKKTYKKLALKVHPDKNKMCINEANRKFNKLNDNFNDENCKKNDNAVPQQEEEVVPVPQEEKEEEEKEKEEEEEEEVVPVPQQEEEEEVVPVPQQEKEGVVPVPQQEKEEVVPVPQQEKEEVVPVPQQQEEVVPVPKENRISQEVAPEEVPVPKENRISQEVAPEEVPVPNNNVEEETKTPTESTDFSLSGLTEPTNTFDQEDQEISKMPSSVSNSFQNIIDYVADQIVGKISNALGYSSGSNEEKLQNGFIANNLNNRNFGVGGRKSLRHPPPEGKGDGLPLRPPLCRTRRSYKKAKKYTRRV